MEGAGDEGMGFGFGSDGWMDGRLDWIGRWTMNQ